MALNRIAHPLGYQRESLKTKATVIPARPVSFLLGSWKRMMRPSEKMLGKYAARLYERRAQALILKWADISIGEWQPQPKECHGNVTEVCAHDPSFTRVRGWLYFDFGGAADCVKFVAHSALRAPDGTLYDITPSSASQQYPFIVAKEGEQEYASLVESGVVELWHRK